MVPITQFSMMEKFRIPLGQSRLDGIDEFHFFMENRKFQLPVFYLTV